MTLKIGAPWLGETITAEVATERARIDADIAALAVERARIDTNVTDIATNAADITTERARIDADIAALAAERARIDTNVTDIATNVADIATERARIDAVAGRLVADLSSDQGLVEGDRVGMAGYYATGDAGDYWTMIYRSTGRSGVTIDGGFYFAGHAADDYYEAQEKTTARAGRFGVPSTGDAAARVQAMFDSGATRIVFDVPTIRIDSPIRSGSHYSKPDVKVIEVLSGRVDIEFTHEQTGTAGPANPSNSDSCFNIFSTNPLSTLLIRGNLSLRYSGTFAPGPTLNDGVVSGFLIGGQGKVDISGPVSATKFNYSGLTVGISGGTYVTINTRNITIGPGCNFSGNREAGIFLSNCESIKIVGCTCNENGLAGSYGEGYGIATQSGTITKDLQVIGNVCNNNFRKGIDSHSGTNILFSENVCLGNKIFGIFGNNIKGSLGIYNNIVGDMRAVDSPTEAVTGIFAGSQETTAPLLVRIEGNIINDVFREAASSQAAYPLTVKGDANLSCAIENNTLSNRKSIDQGLVPLYTNILRIECGATVGIKLVKFVNNIVFSQSMASYLVNVTGTGIEDIVFDNNDIRFNNGRYFNTAVVQVLSEGSSTALRSMSGNRFGFLDRPAAFSLGEVLAFKGGNFSDAKPWRPERAEVLLVFADTTARDAWAASATPTGAIATTITGNGWWEYSSGAWVASDNRRLLARASSAIGNPTRASAAAHLSSAAGRPIRYIEGLSEVLHSTASGSSFSTARVVSKATNAAPSTGDALNLYPTGATVNITGLVDNDVFTCLVSASQSIIVDGVTHTASAANTRREPMHFAKISGVIERIAGN